MLCVKKNLVLKGFPHVIVFQQSIYRYIIIITNADTKSMSIVIITTNTFQIFQKKKELVLCTLNLIPECELNYKIKK